MRGARAFCRSISGIVTVPARLAGMCGNFCGIFTTAGAPAGQTLRSLPFAVPWLRTFCSISISGYRRQVFNKRALRGMRAFGGGSTRLYRRSAARHLLLRVDEDGAF